MKAKPAHWDASTLGELCVEMRNGISAKPDQVTGLPILRISAVRPMKLDLMDRRFLPTGFAGAQQYALRAGDLLFTRYNGNRELVGACARVTQTPGELVYPDKLIRVRLRSDVVEPSFIEKVVASEDSRRFLFERVKTSAGQVGIAGQDLKQLPIPLPPLQEQRRIADRLDALLARVDACRDRLDRVPGILKRFRSAVLAAATGGKLTADWRQERQKPMEWRSCTLADVAEIQGGITKDAKRRSAADQEMPYLRVANVQRGWFDLAEVKTISVPSDKVAALLLKRGDILFNEGGDIDKLGRGWVWEGQIERCVFQNHVFRARLRDPHIQPKYVSWWGNSVGLNYFLRAGKQTTNLASINKSVLSKLPLRLPDADEQAEIVRRVESLLALADAIEARHTTVRRQVERLTPALLAKAFRGELAPQDPSDEPASALLARLRERAGHDEAPAARKPGRRPARTRAKEAAT